MPKLRTGKMYEVRAEMDALRESQRVMTHENYTQGRAARRKAERAERRSLGRKRQEYHREITEWAQHNVKGRASQRQTIRDACANVSREARAAADAPREVQIVPHVRDEDTK